MLEINIGYILIYFSIAAIFIAIGIALLKKAVEALQDVNVETKEDVLIVVIAIALILIGIGTVIATPGLL